MIPIYYNKDTRSFSNWLDGKDVTDMTLNRDGVYMDKGSLTKLRLKKGGKYALGAGAVAGAAYGGKKLYDRQKAKRAEKRKGNKTYPKNFNRN